MKSFISFIFLFILINYITTKEEHENKVHSSTLFSLAIGENNTNISMLFNTFSTNLTLYSNANRKYALEINKKRNHSYIIETLTINEVILPNLVFDIKIDPTDFNDDSIQGEIGLGINLEGRNEFINILYNNKIIFQKEIIIGSKLILDTYLVTKELMWNNSEEINARAIFDSSSKYIFLPIGYLNLILDIWNLNLTKCPLIEDESKVKYIQCNNTNKDYFKTIKPIYFIFEGYALPFSAEELFENICDNKFESLVRFREENYDIWTFGEPLFKKYKVWLKFEKKMIGFNAENVLDFHKDYVSWRKENERILNKASNDKKIVIIGAVMGSMILLTILFCLIKSFKTENSQRGSKFIEELQIPQQQ